MERVVQWGVWYEGSLVMPVADGPSAFLRERTMRAAGWTDAVAVWSVDGARWQVVLEGDYARPDPRPPAQAHGWVEVLRRVGRNRLAFRRRGHD